MNYRLTELQASIAIHQLNNLDKVNKKEKNSDLFIKGLKNIAFINTSKN